VGTVIIRHPTTPRPRYVVEFAGGTCVFPKKVAAESAGVTAEANIPLTPRS
jgi:hypothetical protein